MKADTPALVLYFLACILTVICCVFDLDEWVIYPKAVVVPAIFYCYYVNKGHHIGFVKSAIFLLCFVGDVLVLIDYELSFLISLSCFILVYFHILVYLLTDFKTNKFRKIDILPISITVLFLSYLLFKIMNLDFENEDKYFLVFLFYGLELAILGAISIMNYIAKGTRSTINAVLMWICFLISDIFYMLYHFYVSLGIFELINITTQVLSYYFMMRYFILRDQKETFKAILDRNNP